MLKGINDTAEHANKLCQMIFDFDAKVNLIVYNPIDGRSNLLPSDDQTITNFQKILRANHIPTTVRYSKGKDIAAACGQLRSKKIKESEKL